jgi:hypothetical protein
MASLMLFLFEKSSAAGDPLLTMCESRLVEHQFKVDRTAPLDTIVNNIMSPGLALDVDQYTDCWTNRKIIA